MARFAIVTDLRKCVGCQACTVACSAEWDVPPGEARTRVRATGVAGTFPNLTSSFYVAQCNHCDEPPCVPPCPSGATVQGRNGIVSVDKELCLGCGFCVEACPYGARFIDPSTKTVDKCDFCASRIERGEQPACVATCTAHAKYFGDLEDHGSDVYRMVYGEGARRMETASVAVGPNVYYLGRPEQLDLVQATFPPRAPRTPASADFWHGVARPLVFAAVGATFVGQAVAFFNQLKDGEPDIDD